MARLIIANVKSSSSSRLYTVSRNRVYVKPTVYGSFAEVVDRWECSCPNWTKGNGAKRRDCKHIMQLLLAQASLADPDVYIFPEGVAYFAGLRGLLPSGSSIPTVQEQKVTQALKVSAQALALQEKKNKEIRERHLEYVKAFAGFLSVISSIVEAATIEVTVIDNDLVCKMANGEMVSVFARQTPIIRAAALAGNKKYVSLDLFRELLNLLDNKQASKLAMLDMD